MKGVLQNCLSKGSPVSVVLTTLLSAFLTTSALGEVLYENPTIDSTSGVSYDVHACFDTDCSKQGIRDAAYSFCYWMGHYDWKSLEWKSLRNQPRDAWEAYLIETDQGTDIDYRLISSNMVFSKIACVDENE
jgi:hypothetical protein